MSAILDELKSALKSLEGSIKSDLEEVRKNKSEVQQLASTIFDTSNGIKYIRSDQRVIISAPEIIIGNVDGNGTLISNGGTVTIRGNEVSLEGHGLNDGTGRVTTRAAHIHNIAVDPGADGLENVVCKNSEIVNQARSITIQSNEEEGCFTEEASSGSGVNIFSDNGIGIYSLIGNKTLKDIIDGRSKALEARQKELKTHSDGLKKSIEQCIKDLDKLAEEHAKMYIEEEELTSNHPDMEIISQQYMDLEQILCRYVPDYVRLLSQQAELSRQINILKERKGEVGKNSSNYTKSYNGVGISVLSERISIESVDGDGNIRENPDAGLFVQAPHIAMTAHDKDGKLIKDSTIDVNHQTITVTTGNPALDEKFEKGDIPAVGDVKITSKNITLESLDYELKDKKIQEKALTKTGTINLRAEKIDAQATDTEGKSTGSISMNAKQITAASMDVDKEKRQPKQLAAGSQMVLVSEKIFAGSKDKKTKSKLVQVVSDKVGIMGTSTAEMQQGDGKAVLTLDGGKLAAGGGSNELSGDTTIKGKADIKGDTTAPKGTFKNLEASSSFKSSNISDGIPIPAPAAPGRPSAKMKEEEAKQ